MKTYLIYQGKLYFSESANATQSANGFSAKALSTALNNVSSMASSLEPNYNNSDKKDQLKLVGSQMSKMELWNPILEYFGKYFIDSGSADNLDKLREVQKNLLDKIQKLGIKVANEYRDAKGKYISDEYRTKDDTQFRKVTNIFKHYFYFVALYNMEFLEYIEQNVKNSNIFNKTFADKLPSLYDPPKLTYIENGYLNPKSSSEFNNKILNRADWYSELDEKTNDISSGFSKNEKWDFDRLIQLYVLGLKVDNVKSEKGGEIFINVGDGPERNKDITDINETINDIHSYITDSLVRLKPNLIRSSIKDINKETTAIDLGKKDILKKTEKIKEPYQTQEDLAKMKANFAGTTKTDKDNENVLAATQFQREQNSIINRIKNKISKSK